MARSAADEGNEKRAGDYIFGRMNESERQRAERDLEVDVAFREAVLALAESMHLFERRAAAEKPPAERWRIIAARIAELPQMRRADVAITAPEPRAEALSQGRFGTALRSLANPRLLTIVFGLGAAFVLGYLAAKL